MGRWRGIIITVIVGIVVKYTIREGTGWGSGVATALIAESLSVGRRAPKFHVTLAISIALNGLAGGGGEPSTSGCSQGVGGPSFAGLNFHVFVSRLISIVEIAAPRATQDASVGMGTGA